jgi:hypothetical protein
MSEKADRARRQGLRTFAQRASAAWEHVRQAEAVLQASDGPEPKVALRHVRTARRALERAYVTLTPGRRSLDGITHQPRIERAEPLLRCLLCGALVWEAQRRLHLEGVELLRIAHLPDSYLETWFQVTDRPQGDDEVDEDDADDDEERTC